MRGNYYKIIIYTMFCLHLLVNAHILHNTYITLIIS